MLVFEESVGSDLFCARMWNKLFRWRSIFPPQLWGSFYVILYSLFFTSYVWMDGWMDGDQPSRVFSPLWMDDHVGLLKTPSDSRCQMWCGKSRRIRLYENTD